MKSDKDDIQKNRVPNRPLDEFDRRILGELVRNARQTYAEIGSKVSLSAPAVHDRVKRMTASGAITSTTVAIDPMAVGKPFLAFVHVDASGWGKSERMMKLRDFPEVEELHSVTGDCCVILKVRTANADGMERFLAQVYALPGVRATRSYVVLTTYLDRPVQAETTQDWPEVPLPAD